GAWLLAGRSGTEAPGPAAAAVRRIAVLPFRDLSGRPAGALIGEGFAETVSARLGADAGLAVLPAVAVDEAAGDLAALARRTGAEVLLRGSLQFEGERVRATFAVLAADGRQLAAGAAEGSATRLLDLQDEVARRAAAALGGGMAPLPAVAGEDVAGDRYLEALGHLRRYENEASVDAAIRILEELGGSAPVQAALARAYLAKRTLTADRAWAERALEAGRRAAELAPDLGAVRETRGRLELLLGRPAEAAAEFRRALALQPNAVEAQLGLASALERQGLAAAAEAAYRRAIELQPGWWATHSHLGVFQLLRGEFAAAVESFRAAVRLSPDNTRALANLGAALQQAGRHGEAIAEYERSIAIRPTASALSNLGTCLFYLGRYGEAVPAYERALALQPGSGVLWLNLGDALRWNEPAGERSASAYRRAIGLFEADLAVTPRDAEARTGLALALARTGEPVRARTEGDAALAADPEGAYTLYQVALVRLAAGEDEAGLELLARAAASGYPVSEMARDPELARLKSDPRFGRIRASHPGP
ncbi:MAG TPA: tetratricopeptide repeat protein, partial [Thermoanaerobaculia bacterium]|nr:tetratricopeptide repeat protein [Thermoanaerobaculia bacterium]